MSLDDTTGDEENKELKRTPETPTRQKMTTLTVIPLNRFVYGGDASTLGNRWTDWVEMFDLYVIANEMKEATVIRATFLTMMGDETYQIFKSSCKSTDDLAAIRAGLEKVLVTKRSEYSEICTFRRAKKHSDETVNDYAIRLRHLAKHCKYGEGLEKEIERQFVVSCGMVEVEKACVRDDTLTLEKVLTLALGFERSANQLRGLRQSAEPNHINYNSSKTPYKPKDGSRKPYEKAYGGASNLSAANKCDKCGRWAHKSGEICSAADKECHSCHKIGHYKNLCRSRGESSHPKGEHRSSGYSHRKVNFVGDRGTVEVSLDDYNKFAEYQDAVNYGLNMIRSVGKPGRVHSGPRVSLVTGGNQVQYLIDTGSSANVVGQSTFESRKHGDTLRCKIPWVFSVGAD